MIYRWWWRWIVIFVVLFNRLLEDVRWWLGRLQRIVGGAAEEPHGGTVTYRLVVVGNPAMTEGFPGTAVEGRRGEWRMEGDLPKLNAAIAELVAAGTLVTAFYPEESRLEVEFRRAMEPREP